MKSFLSFLLLLCLHTTWAWGQQQGGSTGTLRGRVLDAESRQPLPSATVAVYRDTLLLGGALTDVEGYFAVTELPLGRVSVRITYPGYTPRIQSGLLLTSGKEMNLDVALVEELVQTEGIEITAGDDKKQALNSLATVSARSFSTEETSRYAGSLGDPARMASNFAGVASAGDTRNDIVVRGNSPLGLLWRLEGVDIPNPNHFATQGANGGPVSIINSNLLANSDFFTGAFPAEYGNATAAAFDLKLRNGNHRKRETAFQVGFNGFELMTEGPLRKGSNASYVASARYSTLAVFDLMGISFGDLFGVPHFQDISFKVNLPQTKLGRFSIFGVGGASRINILESKMDEAEFATNEKLSWQDARLRSGMGVVGLQHSFFVDDKSYIETTLSASLQQRSLEADSLSETQQAFPDYREQSSVRQYTLASRYNRKISARHTLRVGFYMDHYQFDYADSLRLHQLAQWFVNRDLSGSTTVFRPWAQWQWRPHQRLTLNVGAHALLLALEGQQAVEPRAGLRYNVGKRSALSLGYGLHNQLQPWMLYFQQDAQGRTPNTTLDFTRSHHLVLGYDWNPLQNFRIKAEAYVQQLDNVPVSPANPTFSAVNLGAGFDNLPRLTDLENTGTGQNYGVELTLEKFLSQGNYFLVTASIFNSEYTGADGISRSGAFNTRYVVNALAGVERPLGSSGKHTLFADAKLTVGGGVRYTPIDVEASRAANREVRDLDRVWAEQARTYFRTDLTLGWRKSGKKTTQEYSLQLQNVTNHDNVLLIGFNRRTGDAVFFSQLGFFPILQYKITF